MSRTLAKFGLPFDKATPLVHFSKALKHPRNNAAPASIQLFVLTADAVKVGAGGIARLKSIE